MTTGDINRCEIETGHAQVAGRYECRCGYRGFPCEDCGEREYHAPTCSHFKVLPDKPKKD